MNEQYQIPFKKNNLYYKYIKAKNKWDNKFLKQFKNVHDLELDSNAMVELEDEDNYYNSLLPRKNLKKNDLNLSRINRNSSLFKKKNNEKNKDEGVLKKSSIKKRNKPDTKVALLRKSISLPMKLFGKEITNPNQRKLGMRASVSANNQRNTNPDIGIIKTKKTKFNVNSNIH